MKSTAVAEIVVRHPAGAYPVVAGLGALAEAAGRIDSLVAGRRVFVVSSPTVLAHQWSTLAPRLQSAAQLITLEVPDGESAKSLEVAGDLWRRMVAAGGKRDSVLLAFGGGSVGDLGGFVAGAFLRGIGYVQLPTTALAQIDASVGGKTGVDLPEGKNTVGLFHHPQLVVAESAWLSSLPAGEVRAGLVEAVKMAFMLDPGLFAVIERDLEALLDARPDALSRVIAAAVAVKAGVVERDPEERHERKVLNFGHTLAHALETKLGYQGLRHGEAVGWGMVFALDLAAARYGEIDGAGRLRALLARFDLPALPSFDADELIGLMTRDKKATEAGITWVLPRSLGAYAFEAVDPLVVREELRRFLTRA